MACLRGVSDSLLRYIYALHTPEQVKQNKEYRKLYNIDHEVNSPPNVAKDGYLPSC